MLEYLGEKSKANEEDASLVIAQLIETLCYLHRQNIVHLDIRVRKYRHLTRAEAMDFGIQANLNPL